MEDPDVAALIAAFAELDRVTPRPLTHRDYAEIAARVMRERLSPLPAPEGDE